MAQKRIQQKAIYTLPALLSREIGRVIVEWAYLEHYLQGICLTLLRLTGEEGRIAIRTPRLSDRLDMILDLLFLNNLHADASFTKSMRTRIEEHGELRDLFAHGIWTFSEQHQKWAVQNTRGSWSRPGRSKQENKKRITPEGLLVSKDAVSRTVGEIDKLIRDARQMQTEIEAQLQERA